MQYKVLVSAPYFQPVVGNYKRVFDHHGIELVVPAVHERLSEEELLSLVGDIDGIIAGDDRITARVLDAAPKLRVISKWGTGIDSFDQEAAAAHGVTICRTLNAFTLPVADSVMGYVLNFARRHADMDRAMKKGVWEKIPGRSLSECTMGVIGAGNCGKAVLRRAAAFGMKLLGTDIRAIEPEFIAEYRVEMTTPKDLLGRADFVSVNCDLNTSSWHIINERRLSMMKPTAVLINSARGPLVDEEALIFALQADMIAGAALDVFEVEPLPLTSPLLKMDNVMLAPHNSNSSPAAWARVHESTLNNLLQGLGISR